MTPYWEDPDAGISLYLGDCLDVLPTLADASVDAVVCDPPYEISMMDRAWDSTGIAYNVDVWRQCWRILKPGGHLLAFGGTRTYHRMTVAIEDAGFEIRDSLHWIYGSGFPKSLDVSKAIDKAAGAQREVVGIATGRAARPRNDMRGGAYGSTPSGLIDTSAISVPATEDAARWEGWGTALKPAHEPIVLARRPFTGTVVANVLQHGTGALNIDDCRIVAGQDYRDKCASVVGIDSPRNGDTGGERTGAREDSAHTAGRWPTNVLLTHPPLLDDTGQVVGDACADGCVPWCPVAEMDAQSGYRADGPRTAARSGKSPGTYGAFTGQDSARKDIGDGGGASRFFQVFRYQAKAPKAQRPRLADGTAHPTVKPLDLMRWLVRLVTPPGGTVLDWCAGTGTTLEAASLEGFRAIGIEREADHAELCVTRLSKPIASALFAP